MLETEPLYTLILSVFCGCVPNLGALVGTLFLIIANCDQNPTFYYKHSIITVDKLSVNPVNKSMSIILRAHSSVKGNLQPGVII